MLVAFHGGRHFPPRESVFEHSRRIFKMAAALRTAHPVGDSAPLTGASLRVGSSGRATAQRRARPQQFEWNTGAGAERLRGTERIWAGKSNGVPVTVCRTARVSSGSLPSDQWMRRTHRVDHTPL